MDATSQAVNATPSFPPAGFVDRHEAARMFGISDKTWGQWERRGRVGGGRMVPKPPMGTRVKLYAIDDLRRRLEESKAPPVFPPEGFVDQLAAARILGMAKRTLSTWEREGRVACGRVVPIPGKPGTAKIYPIDALRRMADELQATRARLVAEWQAAQDFKAVSASSPFPPAGFVTRLQSCGIIGIKLKTLSTWESEGRFKHGVSSPIPGKPGRCTLYPIDEVNQLAEEYRRANAIPEPYPDPDRPGVVRVPVNSSKHPGMEAIVDAADLALVQGRRFWWGPGHREGDGAVKTKVDGECLSVHQVVMGVRGIKHRVGHLNGDPLDCRRENLIVRTASEQKAANRKIPTKAGKPTSSQYKGVSRVSPTARWTVSIKAHGELLQLGRFKSEIAAALAYDDAAREAYGEHAQLNFSDPEEIARMRAIALEEESAAPPPFPPPGFIDRRGACRMFGVSFNAWKHWERTGRVRCGKWVRRPLEKRGGKCRLYPIDELNRLLEEFNNVGKPYPDPDWRNCWRVPIRSMIHRMEAIIDAEDLPLVEGKYWNWSARSNGHGARVTLATTGKTVQLDRLIARVTDPEQKVSHLNRDPLDCRRANIIVRTMAEQAPANRKMGTVSGQKYSSRFKGVSWDSSRERWHVQITSGEVHRYLGRFRDELAAAEAYDEAARELFGEHAYLNFADGVDAWLEAEAQQMERAAAA